MHVFANNIVLVNGTREGIYIKLDKWRETLDSIGSRISRRKYNMWNTTV